MIESLNLRLRAEADEWDEGEDVKALLIEAAEAVELLAGKVAIQEWAQQAALAPRRVGCGRCGGTGGVPAGPFGGGRDSCPVCGGSGSVVERDEGISA